MSSSKAVVRAETGAMDANPGSAGRSWHLPVDFIFRKIASAAAFLVALVLFATVFAIAYDSRAAIKKFGILAFLTSNQWDPVTQVFGAVPFIAGTLISSAIAMLLAVPISFGIAVFIAEVAPTWIKKPIAAA